MLDVRPLVVANGYVVGGNMRLLAMKDLGYKEVPVIDVTDWTQGQRDEFMIKDNINFGEWDYDLLANEWEGTDLDDWGLDLWQPELPDLEEEVLSEALKGIKVEFEEDDYDIAIELVKALKKGDKYIGGIFLEALRKQFK